MGSSLAPVLFGPSIRLGTCSTSSKGTELAPLWSAAPGRQTSICAAWASHHMST